MEESTGGQHQHKEDDSASKDAEIWKELLQKAQTGTTNEPYFLARIVQSCLHTTLFCKIGLPGLFLDHHHKSLKEKVTLEGPDGHKWPVMLGLSWTSKPYIMHGWKEFSHGHKLQVGDQVVFFLVADSHFMVQVFDAYNNAKPRPLPAARRKAVPRRETKKQAEAIQRKEELAQRTRSNVQTKLNGVGEVGASHDRQRAPQPMDPAQVKVEALASGEIPVETADKRLEPTRQFHMQSSAAEGREIFHILDSSEEENEKLTSKVAPRAAAKSDAFGKTNNTKVKMRTQVFPPKCEEHEQQIERASDIEPKREETKRMDQMEVTASGRDLDLTHPSKLQESKLLKVRGGLADHNGVKRRSVEVDDDTGQDSKMKHTFQKGDSIMKKLLGVQAPSTSLPPEPEIVPSSPEQLMTLKRSRKLQRKTGVFEDSEAVYTPSLVRLQKLLTLNEERLEVAALQAQQIEQACRTEEADQIEQSRKAGRKPVRRTPRNQSTKAPELDARKDAKGKRLVVSHRAHQAALKRHGAVQQSKENFGKVAEGTIVEPGDHTAMDFSFCNLIQAALEGAEGVVKTQATVKRETTEPILQTVKETPKKPGQIALKSVKRETTEPIIQTVKEAPKKPGWIPLKSRPKVMISKNRGESTFTKESSPPKEVKHVYKRPTRSATAAPPKPPPFIYISKRRPVTDEERRNVLLTAHVHAQKTPNQKFVLQLKSTQVYCGYHLGVPQGFVDAMQLPHRRMTVTLFDFTGKTWEVEWLGDHPHRPGLHSAGWTKFVLEHYLEEGDACVFELQDPLHFNILVHIFPVVELTAIAEDGWKSHYSQVPDTPPHPVEVVKQE